MIRRLWTWLLALADTNAEKFRTDRYRAMYEQSERERTILQRELTRLGYEVNRLRRENEDLRGKREIWTEPLRLVKGGKG